MKKWRSYGTILHFWVQAIIGYPHVQGDAPQTMGKFVDLRNHYCVFKAYANGRHVMVYRVIFWKDS